MSSCWSRFRADFIFLYPLRWVGSLGTRDLLAGISPMPPPGRMSQPTRWPRNLPSIGMQAQGTFVECDNREIGGDEVLMAAEVVPSHVDRLPAGPRAERADWRTSAKTSASALSWITANATLPRSSYGCALWIRRCSRIQRSSRRRDVCADGRSWIWILCDRDRYWGRI